METRTYNVYTWGELPEDGKRKALERYGDINVYHEWWYLDWFKERLSAVGFLDADIQFSGFGS